MAITLPELPYAQDALEPHLSQQTLQFHYGKHHKGYVDKTNGLIEGTPLANADLEEIVRKAASDGQTALFNNAAQVWNHTFFWKGMKPSGGGAPDSYVANAIDKAFGGMDSFKKAFGDAAMGRFGSGWAWLVYNKGGLEIVTTPNAETPLTTAAKPLLTCDVWEHAYYLDYKNERAKFVDTFLGNLVNWEFVAERLGEAQG